MLEIRREGDIHVDLRQDRHYETNNLLQQVTRVLDEGGITVHRQPGESLPTVEEGATVEVAEPLDRIERQRFERERILYRQLLQNLVEQHVLKRRRQPL